MGGEFLPSLILPKLKDSMHLNKVTNPSHHTLLIEIEIFDLHLVFLVDFCKLSTTKNDASWQASRRFQTAFSKRGHTKRVHD